MSESNLEDKCTAAQLGIWHRDGATVYWFHCVIKIVQNAHSVVMLARSRLLISTPQTLCKESRV